MISSAIASTMLFGSLITVILYFVILVANKAVGKQMTFVFVLALSCISVCVIPNKYWDLYRHYEFLDDIRNSSLTMRDFLFNNNRRIGGSDYKSLVFFNVIRYFVAQSGENKLFPFIMTLITYSIWGFISHDWFTTKNANTRELFYGLLINMVLIPYLFVISGLRNTTASALVALAFYECKIKGKSIVYAIPLFGMACTIHMSCVYMAAIFLVSYIRNAWIVIFCSIVFSRLTPLLAQLLSTSETDYLAKMANSYIAYFMSEKTGGSSMYLAGDFFALIPIAILAIRLSVTKNKSSINSLQQRITEVVFTFVVFMMCNVGKNALIIRSAYTLGILSVPMVSCYLSANLPLKGKMTDNREKILLLFVGLGFAVVMRYSLAELVMSEWAL